jgi:DNA-binding IclR family transcriptional regulator
MLSALPPDELQRIIDRLVDPSGDLPGSGARTIRNPRQLIDDLAEQRRRGYATSTEEAEEGISAIAVAVRTPGGVPLAISIAFGAAQFTPEESERFVAAVQAAAHAVEISAQGSLTGGFSAESGDALPGQRAGRQA